MTMLGNLRLYCDGTIVPFSVGVHRISEPEIDLLRRLVSPFWKVEADSDDTDLVTIELVRRSSGIDGSDTVGGHQLRREGRKLDLFIGGGQVEAVLAIIDIVRVLFKVSMLESYSGRNCHAGAVDSRGRGVLFSGARGSGKTTVLRACAAHGLRLVANDQCVLLPGTETVAVGFPALVAVRPESSQTSHRLPARAITVAPDKQDGIIRRRYSLPALASVNGTTCVSQTRARLLISYEQSKSPRILRAAPLEVMSWFDTAKYELTDAYDHRLVELALDLVAHRAPDSEHVDLRLGTKVRHYRVACSADMLDKLPTTLVELLDQP